MSRLKKWLKGGVTLLAINYLTLPILFPIIYSIMGSSINHKKLEQEIINNKFNHNLPEDYGVLEYLTLAQTSSSYIREHYYGIATPVCKDMGKSTYHAYQFLTELNDREDLQKNIRITLGMVDIEEMNKQFAHAWIEYKIDDGKFKPFETTIFSYTIENESNLNYSKENLLYFNEMLEEDIMWRYSHNIPNTKLYYPTLESFYRGYGLAGLSYTFVKTCPEILEYEFPEFWNLITKDKD